MCTLIIISKCPGFNLILIRFDLFFTIRRIQIKKIKIIVNKQQSLVSESLVRQRVSNQRVLRPSPVTLQCGIQFEVNFYLFTL